MLLRNEMFLGFSSPIRFHSLSTWYYDHGQQALGIWNIHSTPQTKQQILTFK